MKCLVHVIKYTIVLCLSCNLIEGLYLLEDLGELGKKFWGQNHTIMEGQNLTLQCGSKLKSGEKRAAYYWFWVVKNRSLGKKKLPQLDLLQMHGRKLTKIKPFGFTSTPEHVPGTLSDMKLINVNRYAPGKYVCAVATVVPDRRSNYVEVTFQNVVVKSKPRIESKMVTKIDLNADSKLTLDCMSSGFPTPEIKWRRLDGRPLPIRTVTHSEGLLSIYEVGQLDRGDYQCISLNPFGNDTRTFSVNITVRPRILSTNQRSYASIGKKGVIKCVAVGLPPPKFSWKWYDKGYPQKLTKHEGQVGRFKVMTVNFFENSTSYLIIKNVERVDLRIYECEVKRDDVTISEKLRLYGYTKPDQPIINNAYSNPTSITVIWKLGENDGGKPVTLIVIEYLASGNGTEWQNVTIQTKNRRSASHTIHNLRSGTEYKLRLRAINQIGTSQPSVNLVKETDGDRTTGLKKKNVENKGESVDMMVMVFGVAGAFLVLIIAIVIICILMRNIQRNSARKAAENAQRLPKRVNSDAATALLNYFPNSGDRLSIATGSAGGELSHLTASNKWEFQREKLVLQNVLGSGAFGIVMKAEAEGINGFDSGTTPVAVKFVKENESASAKKDLIAELELLKLIEPHKNVINLLGCCTRSEPLMVIVEFCAYGDLQSFLRASRGIRDQYYLDCYKRPSSRLTSKELLMFGTQISRGMAHLACLKVIHRDLAARNILVDENKVCKVSDFGFARDIYEEDHYTRKTAGGRFPIKWMAIESLLDGISTTKSDVWSFAIVLWEIITLGASPYPGMNSQEVVSFLQNGMRMDKPKHCSDELYNLLLDCWQVAPHRRPSFEMLARYLDRMCNDDFEYINMRTYEDHLYINFDGNTISENSKSGSLMKQDTEESTSEKDSN